MDSSVSKPLWETHIIPMILRSDPYNTRQRAALARVSRFFHQVVNSIRILAQCDPIPTSSIPIVLEFDLRPQLVVFDYYQHYERSRIILRFLYQNMFNLKHLHTYCVYTNYSEDFAYAHGFINTGLIKEKLKDGKHVLFISDPNKFRIEWIDRHATVNLNSLY